MTDGEFLYGLCIACGGDIEEDDEEFEIRKIGIHDYVKICVDCYDGLYSGIHGR